MRGVLVVIGVAVLLANCDASDGQDAPGAYCPASAPLDCGNGKCCPTATPYYCPDDGAPHCFPYGPADGPACQGYILCGGGSTGSASGGSAPCAHWSCGTSSQCAEVLGGTSGVQCQFAAGQTCAQWCQEYVPGNCDCQ
jgi:hypothetical protein